MVTIFHAPHSTGQLAIAVSAGLVPVIYVSRLHKRFLLDGLMAFVFAAAAISIATLAWSIAIRTHFERSHIAVAFVLSCPAVDLVLFRVGFKAFVRHYGREPEDIGTSVAPGRWPDVWFRLLVLVVLGLVPIGTLTWYFFNDLP